MQLTLDEFDTKILTVPSYKTLVSTTDQVSDLAHAMSGITDGFITCFTPFDPRIHRQMFGLGFDLISLRSEYQFKEKSAVTVQNHSVQVWDQLQDPKDITTDEWDAIIAPVASLSRYAKDTFFDIHSAFSIYHQWILNSLHGYASHVFCARVEGKLAGVLTMKPKDDRLFIDLLSVDTGFQSQGIGTALLSFALSAIPAQNKLAVITEGENISANRFYQRQGFCLESLQCVYHFHSKTRKVNS